MARSENIPRGLCAQLTALSILREPRGGSVTTGPQYSYNILNHAGGPWHVLTCTQCAGADYSGRICHISHHLILNQDEVRTLHNHTLRPTPAGLMQALQNNGFWKSRWEGEPQYLTNSPTLSPGDMPDAEAQPTWKKLTGHKANARALYTAPFERDCLITVPPGTSSGDVLSLFHESDWLTHTRGWGITFTTVADDADSFAETLRMVTAPASPLVQRAQRTGHPVLNIEQGMEIPLPAPACEPPQSLPLQPGASPQQKSELMRTLSRSVSHYHYIEEPDWLMFDVRPQRSKSPYILSGVAGLAALGLLAWYYYTPAGYSPEEGTVAIPTEHIRSADNVQRLSCLLNTPYDHGKTASTLAELSNIEERTREDSLLLETVAIINNATQPGARHALAARRLCECARLLGLKDRDLVLLYLHEATFNTSPEEWQKQFDGQHMADWLSLKQSEPQILGLLDSEDLRAYAPGEKKVETTILATATPDAPPQKVDDSEQTPPPGRISLIPSAAVSGMPLPPELEEVISSLPVSICTGSYVISSFEKGGELQEPKRLNLSPDGYRLYITHTEKDGEITLRPEHAEGKESPVPACSIKIQKGKLQSIRSNGKDSVVCFPVATKKDFHTNIILASSFGIPIPATEPIILPPVAKANLDISEKSIELVTENGEPRLRISNTSAFPWVETDKELQNIRFSVNLPVLTGHNAMQQTGRELKTYRWTEASVMQESDALTVLRCNIIHNTHLPKRLEEAFNQVANEPCCGEVRNTKSPSHTLARLYYICSALDNEKLSMLKQKQLLQDYFSLFANKNFNRILTRILEKETYLHLKPEQATSKHFKAIQLRNNIKNCLNDKNVRKTIRKRICEVLTRTLYAAYTQEQQEQIKEAASPPILILKNISIGNHVELLWQFQMRKNTP